MAETEAMPRAREAKQTEGNHSTKRSESSVKTTHSVENNRKRKQEASPAPSLRLNWKAMVRHVRVKRGARAHDNTKSQNRSLIRH